MSCFVIGKTNRLTNRLAGKASDLYTLWCVIVVGDDGGEAGVVGRHRAADESVRVLKLNHFKVMQMKDDA